MLTLLMILLGGAAYQQLPRDLFPDVSQPELMVETEYDGAASTEIEQNVTRKIEEKLGTVKGVTGMVSTSGEEYSRVNLTFGWGTNMDLAAMDVRAKLDEVRGDLPEEVGEPIVLQGSSSSGAIMVLNVASNPQADQRVHPDELREVVDRLVKPRLERLNGVAAVVVTGGKEYEVRVRAIPERLRSAELSILDIRDALERENLSQRGGKLREQNDQFLIRTVGSFSIEELSDLIVSRPGDTIRRLGEVAEVSPSEVEKSPDSFARLRTQTSDEAIPSVEVSIFKKSGGNSVEICGSARTVRTEILGDLVRKAGGNEAAGAEGGAALGVAAPLQIAVAYDESVFIEESLDMVRSNGVFGLLLASCILFVFLQRLQSTLIVVLSMPVSVIATFSLFYAGNISVNIFSMAGLTLAVGMVVDNAIVVTEAIFQKMSYERRVKKAVTEAITEIGPAIWASTLTTVAVFLPVVFVPGIAGQIFRDLSWVITYTLIFSMVVAFTLIPMLTFKVMSLRFWLFDAVNFLIRWIMWLPGKAAKAVSLAYKGVLQMVIGTLSVRILLIAGLGLFFVVVIQRMPPSNFFPETKVESYSVTLRPRVGQTLESVDRAARILEQQLEKVSTMERYSISISTREVRAIATFNKTDVANEVIKPVGELEPVLSALRNEPGLLDSFLDFRFESLNPMQSLLGTAQGDILLKVAGPDLRIIQQILRGGEGRGGLLDELARQQASYGIASLGKVPGGIPERILRVKREAAADRGLSLSDIADQVEMAVAGSEATEITIDDTTYDIMLSSAAEMTSGAALLNLDIVAPNTKEIWKLADVATLETQSGPQQINREERERVITIPIFVNKDQISVGEVVGLLEHPEGPVERAMAPYQKAGYRVKLGGASEAMNQSLSYMLYAFLVAVMLVYMIMASQFESLIHPLTIMFSVPLSLIGAIIGLNLAGELLSLTAMIGVIMLAGIVVNNAIILVDYVNILRARGQPRNEAIVNAGLTRLRPILMTTLTTVLGMFPLALGYGTGAELYRPLAVVVVCGLSFSTILTLLFIPAVYCLFDDISDLIGLTGFRLSMLLRRKAASNATAE